MTYLRECGRCHDLWPIDAVRCDTCNSLLVLTAPIDTTPDRRFGKRPVGRAKDAS